MVNQQESVEFQTDRVVCIDRGNVRLFAEIIDTTPDRARCWVRPLALAQAIPTSFDLEFLHDLRETSQLILPAALFREAVDTEVFPLLSALFHSDSNPNQEDSSRQALHQFIQDLYRSGMVMI
jgi:hypothetical protein